MSDLSMRLSATSLVGRLARLPLRLIPRRQVMPVLSGPLKGARWVVGAGLHSCWLGMYESDKARGFAERVQPGMTVWDIGAHVGFYALVAARRAGPGGRVYAFEPSPRNLPFLKRHVELNAAANVTVLGCAVSGTPGEMGFEMPHAMNGDGYTGRISANGGGADTVRVRVETLDGLIAEGRITPAQVVKMDVEGAEFDALRGGRAFFMAHRPTLFLATHSQEVHEACCALLREWGYTLSSLDEGVGIERTREVLAVAGPVVGEGKPRQAVAAGR